MFFEANTGTRKWDGVCLKFHSNTNAADTMIDFFRLGRLDLNILELLLEEILHRHGKHPIIYQVLYIPGGDRRIFYHHRYRCTPVAQQHRCLTPLTSVHWSPADLSTLLEGLRQGKSQLLSTKITKNCRKTQSKNWRNISPNRKKSENVRFLFWNLKRVLVRF